VGAREFSIKRFGFPTRAIENPVVAQVGVDAVTVLQNNPDRVFWLIINLSDNTIYVAFKSDVSATKGIRLDANGGFASACVDEDGELPAYEVFAMATGAASAIYVLAIEKLE